MTAAGRYRRARVRADELLVARGLASSRAEALRLILAGRVTAAGVPVDKGGRLLPPDAAVRVREAPRFVSRGGEKLEAALRALGVDPAGCVCLDVGASTGGFTDCLLHLGARRVYAVDVGHGQLHPRLRADPRVRCLEGVNARHLVPALFPEPPSLAVVDVSFISLEKVLPAVAACLAVPAGGTAAGQRPTIVALVKPQFEAGPRAVGRGGVVRDPAVHREVLLRLVTFAARQGLGPRAVVDSPLRGPKGNREFFLHLEPGRPAAEDLVAAVHAVVGETW